VVVAKVAVVLQMKTKRIPARTKTKKNPAIKEKVVVGPVACSLIFHFSMEFDL
jgi:hypothetical protein